jgi:hypothetical protein
MNKDKLEILIDNQGLDAVLELIGNICFEKSEHLAMNWQDEKSAKQWDRIAYVVHATARKVATIQK